MRLWFLQLWKPVPWMTLFTSEDLHENAEIPALSQALERQYHGEYKPAAQE